MTAAAGRVLPAFPFTASRCIHGEVPATSCALCSWESVVSPLIRSWIRSPHPESEPALEAARELLLMAHAEIDDLRIRLKYSIGLPQFAALEHELEACRRSNEIYKKRLGLPAS
jgi:hypothetical protein